ncbi:RNA polymerase sigma-70 factor [Spirosoma luteum]|uniref:RNA polymerase sigma-70 factor n=1 Tax=Spirosoma luteum TaxID=431553 RepID=UPI000379A2A9|nr:RNA polymerase sigma-70 factor [Spirosoma luteum]
MADTHSEFLYNTHLRPLHPRPDTDVPLPLVTDSELLIRQGFAQSPIKGYELLFNRYYKPLCSHAARFVYDRQLSEDIVVDAFAQFWQKRLDLVVTTSFRAYLFTIVRNRAFAHLRQEFGHEPVSDHLVDTDPTADGPTPLQVLQFNELQLKINETIQAASAHSQKVFVMSRFEGKKNGQIADELGVSIKTVEGHITKMLTLLRQVLRQNGLLTTAAILSFALAEPGIKPLLRLIRDVTQLNI